MKDEQQPKVVAYCRVATKEQLTADEQQQAFVEAASESKGIRVTHTRCTKCGHVNKFTHKKEGIKLTEREISEIESWLETQVAWYKEWEQDKNDDERKHARKQAEFFAKLRAKFNKEAK